MAKKPQSSGPDADGQKKTKSVLIFVSAEVKDKMGEISKASGLKNHELVTEAINNHIKNNPKKPITSIRELIEKYMEGQSADAILLAREEAELAELKKKVDKRRKKVNGNGKGKK